MHLPNGCQYNGTWHRIFIPTYFQYLACRESDAWAANDDESVSVLQKIWNFVYGDKVPHIITIQGPVFALVGVTFLIQVPRSLIASLHRSINMFVNGVGDLLPLPCPLLMLFLMTMTSILMRSVKNLRSLLWKGGRFSTVM